MTGQDMVNLMYLIAMPVNGDLRKVQVFSEAGVIYVNAIGKQGISFYERSLKKSDMAKLREMATWDEKFDRWSLNAPMRKSAPLKTGANVEKFNFKKVPDTKLSLPTLMKNVEIKKSGDTMTENEVNRKEYQHLKETGQTQGTKLNSRYDKLKDKQ